MSAPEGWSREEASRRGALADPVSLGLDPAALDALHERARRDLAGRPGAACQLAVGRWGRLAHFGTAGRARFGDGVREATDGDRFAIFSATKALVASACWILLQEGRLSLGERVADAIPGFGENGKAAVTVEHLLVHTAGFPKAQLDPAAWADPERRRSAFASWRLEWEPGSRFVYHGTSSMWVLAELIARRAECDYRDFVHRRILEPIGLPDLFLGLPAQENARVADVCLVGEAPSEASRGASPVDAPAPADESLEAINDPASRAVGTPGGGAVATAAALAMFYQALLADAEGRGPGIWRPETLADAWAVRNPELIDGMTGQPALRGLGVVVAGAEGRLWRGFAESCSARSFGHMGLGGQIAWADPESGLSFAFLTSAADRDPARQGGRGFRLSGLVNACLAGG